jgi:hypothetical protein
MGSRGLSCADAARARRRQQQIAKENVRTAIIAIGKTNCATKR